MKILKNYGNVGSRRGGAGRITLAYVWTKRVRSVSAHSVMAS